MILLFVPLLAAQLNLPFWQIGILTAAFFAPYTFCSIFGKIADRFDRFSIIFGGLFLAIIPLIFLSIARAPFWIGIFSMAIAFCLAIIQPANLGIVASLAPKNHRKHLAGLEMFFERFGVIFGSLFFGFIGEKFGLQAVFFSVAILTFLFASFAGFLRTRSFFAKFDGHNFTKNFVPVSPFHVHKIGK